MCVSAKKYAELHAGQGDKKKEKKEKAPKQQEPKKEAKPKEPVGTTHIPLVLQLLAAHCVQYHQCSVLGTAHLPLSRSVLNLNLQVVVCNHSSDVNK